VVFSVEGSIVETNPAFTTIFGYQPAEVVGRTVEMLFGDDGDFRTALTRSGSMRQVEVVEQPLPPDDRSILTIIRDVTERNAALKEADVLAYQYAADLTAVSQVARRLPRTTDSRFARNAICQALLEVCDAMLAVLMEPDGESGLVSTGTAGGVASSAPLRVAVDEAGSATADVFKSGEPFFIADLALHEDVSPRLTEETGIVSALWQPVLRDGCVVGVLVVGWDRPVMHLSDRAAAVAGLFAAEAAVAIERADSLAQLEALNRALAMQLDALRVSDQLKTDFISSVSHELRTPLTAILGYTEMLASEAVGEINADQGEFLGIVDQNARRLEALITDILTLSGVESGKLTLRREPTDLRRLVEGCIRDQILTFNARRQDIVTAVPDAPVMTNVDSERLGQVVANLLSNAAKFTPVDGRVEISLGVRDTGRGRLVELAVSDSGIGIPEDDLPRLFERFFRARNATDHAIPGTGLGLAICCAIVEAHQGRLTVTSTLGVGTTVTVSLPFHEHPPKEED
jgi:signal transduction histidine kinase